MVFMAGIASAAPEIPAPLEFKPSVPHSSHITMMFTDYRYHQIPIEYLWTTSHYDHVISGEIARFHERAPALKYYAYALNLTVIRETRASPPELNTTYYSDMHMWYGAHSQFNIEDAFLHDASLCPEPTPKIEACRIQTSWGVHARWVVNPGDPGLRAYDADRLVRVTTRVQGTRYDADGIFFDEHSSGGFTAWKSFSIREYPIWSRYEDDVVTLLEFERKALGKLIVLNTSEFIGPIEQRMVLAAGGAHMEAINTPFSNQMRERWSFIDALLKEGAFVEMVNSRTWSDMSRMRSYPQGNDVSGSSRYKLAELCSYYMVVPRPATNLALDITNEGWNENYSWQWLKAAEVDVGGPVGPRTLFSRGPDPRGKPLQVWRREFDKALVFMRYQKPWEYTDYGDSTAIPLELPPGETWYPLKGDGTLGDPVTSVKIRNVEGVIVLKGSALTPH